MNKQTILGQKAVQAAKAQEWEKAIEINQELLDIRPNDLGALNRIGLAYTQLNKTNKARDHFKQVLAIDSSNTIAKKNLDKIKNKQKTVCNFSGESFIEEPGKTDIVELHRPTSKEVMAELSSGQECTLSIKKRYISVESDGKYIGTLPEDLSFRLTKLIKRGNKYESRIYSISPQKCTISIYIKEVFRSKKNQNINSFPLNKENIAMINDIDETFLLEHDVPIEIISTDTDQETIIENAQPAEEK